MTQKASAAIVAATIVNLVGNRFVEGSATTTAVLKILGIAVLAVAVYRILDIWLPVTIGLALGRHRLSSTGLRSALGTGGFIAAYSVTDGMGVRLAAHPMAYTAWMCAMWGVLMPLVYISRRGVPSLFAPRPGRYTALMGGVISLVAYGLVIHAMQVAPMGAVSALRETSVLFAALIGYVFLGESLSLQKCAACVVITTGIFIVG